MINEKTKINIHQIVRFVIVGGIAFLIDSGILWGLTEFLGLWYLISAMISFVISLVFNYFASMKYVFNPFVGMTRKKQFFIFVGLSVIGLGLNEFIMWIFVDNIGLHYMMSKVVATSIVMVYNFISKKAFLEGGVY